MKFVPTTALLLAAAVSAAPPPQGGGSTCEETGYDLMVDDIKIGDINIYDDELFNLQVEVVVTNDLTPNDPSDDAALTTIAKVYGDVCCPEVEGVQDCIPFDHTPPTAGMQSFTFTIAEPTSCLKDARKVTAHADLVKKARMAAFNELFPQSIKFSLSADDGSDVGDSYFDATIIESEDDILNGQMFDGNCIDVDHEIYLGTDYTGTAMSYTDTDFQAIGMDKPQNLDALAYCINHWFTGRQYTKTISGVEKTYTLSSGTMQRAIWYLIDYNQYDDPGSDYEEDWALYIKDDCLNKGEGFVPGCDEKFPIVIVPDDNQYPEQPKSQTIFVMTTFANLNLPCRSRTANGEANVFCEPQVRTPPPKTPGGGGDPHFQTWAGKYFDYHGQCDMVLLHNEGFHNGMGMDIHVRTKARYDYSYIESVAVRIGLEDILEVSSFGHYLINGMAEVDTPFMMADKFVLEHEQVSDKKHSFDIHLGSDDHILITTFKDLVNVKLINATKSNFEGSVGLMGTFGDGSLLARNGKKKMAYDVNAYGQEWQVLDTEPKLFQVADHFPQYPQECALPEDFSGKAFRPIRRLGESIAKPDAEQACSHLTGERKQMCIFDVLATNDLEVAQAGAF